MCIPRCRGMTSTRVWTTTPCFSPTSTLDSRRQTLGSPLRRSTRWSARGLWLLNPGLFDFLLFREEPIPEEKRESCANTELGPEVVNQSKFSYYSWVEPKYTKMQVKNNCTIFLGYTSNMASCGVRDTLRCWLQTKVQNMSLSNYFYFIYFVRNNHW